MEWLKEWAMPLSAGATLILAITAFWAIWQNHQIQKRERRDRQINEIIDWAINLTKHPLGTIFRDLANATGTKKVELFIYSNIAETMGNLKGLLGRNIYIHNLSLSFDINLQNSVSQVIKDLAEYIEFLNGWYSRLSDTLITNVPFNDEDFSKWDKHADTLSKSALKVIEEATKIKT
jgi:hypothetical protein